MNRVPFKGKVGGEPLPIGTYLVSAATRRSAKILRVTLVVFERGTPTRAALREARLANVCPASTFLAAARGGSDSDSDLGTVGLGAPTKPSVVPEAPGAAGDGSSSKSAGDVLGAAVETAAAKAIKPLAVIALAMAILLLGLAALPRTAVPDPRLNDLLVRHRPEIALAGAAAMVAGIAYFLIS